MVPNTKTRILQTALRLYNEHGVYNPHGEQITARRIAAELNMSDGNLRYHYPSREDILRGLYDELSTQLKADLAAVPAGKFRYHEWLDGLHRVYETMYAYRFLYKDFVGIMQHQPELHLHYRLLQQERREVFQHMMKTLLYEGYLRPEPARGQFDRMYDLLQIQADFWIASTAFPAEEQAPDLCREQARLSLSLFIPYLSVIGLDKWRQAAEAEVLAHPASAGG